MSWNYVRIEWCEGTYILEKIAIQVSAKGFQQAPEKISVLIQGVLRKLC